MSQRATPPPPDQGNPTTPGPISTPIPLPPPQTPASTRSIQPYTPIPHTPSSAIRACTNDANTFLLIKVHTAKCSECDKRNKDTMLRCPGCTFQVCKPCRERRDKAGKGLGHGIMLSPGGLELVGAAGSASASGLGSGSAVRRRVVMMGVNGGTGMIAEKVDKMEGVKEEGPQGEENGRGGESVPAPKSTSKKRSATKTKSKTVMGDESSDDEFTLDAASPSSNKRRRIGLALTNRPTATSIRPSRRASAGTDVPNYEAPSSTDSEGSTGIDPAINGDLSSSLDADIPPRTVEEPKTADANKQDTSVVPKDRIQELLEQHGVNTPENPYQQHFLSRCYPSISTSTHKLASRRQITSIQPAITEQTSSKPPASPLTVRTFTTIRTTPYLISTLDADLSSELTSSTLSSARKWAMKTYAALPAPVHAGLKQGLDMRLDLLDESYVAQLGRVIEECAQAKLREFEEDAAV